MTLSSNLSRRLLALGVLAFELGAPLLPKLLEAGADLLDSPAA